MLRNCTICGKMFSHPTQKVCPACYKEEQKYFEMVKEYLREFPKASVSEVVEETGVALSKVEEFVRQGRLSVIPSGMTLYCQVCQDPIPSGRLCQTCSNQLYPAGGQKPSLEKQPSEPKSTRARMHLFDKIRDK